MKSRAMSSGANNRRSFLLSALSVFTIVSLPLLPQFQYKVQFKMSYPSIKFKEFEIIRNSWEDQNKIKQICQKFAEDKKLIQFDIGYGENNIIWTYIFDSENSFNEWNTQIISSKSFQPEKIPGLIKYQQILT